MLLAGVLFASSATLVAAAPVTLAPDTLVFNSDRTGNKELFTMPTTGGSAHRLTQNSTYDSWWGRISPDRQHILFYRTPKSVNDPRQNALWMMNADGTNQHQVLPVGAYGWSLQGHAEWSPDGQQLVMQGGSTDSPQIFIVDALGRPTQLTNRAGSNIDPSWSADGRTIVFAGCTSATCAATDEELYVVPALGGTPTRITADTVEDHDPYFSPDGTRIAWLRHDGSPTPTNPYGAWNIFLGGGAITINVTNDGNLNSKPQWSRDGSVLYFHRYVIGGSGRWNLYSIHPDGSALTELSPGAAGNNEYPSI